MKTMQHTLEKRRVALLLILGCALYALVGAATAHAQVELESLIGADIELRPQYPQANERVSATFKTSYVNIATSLITWKMDGEVVQQGYGKREYVFTTGDVGQRIALEVTAVDTDGKKVVGSEYVLVGDMAVVWEGETYTPPLYKGRALYTSGSHARVMVLPSIPKVSGGLYAPEELTYEWTINGSFTPTEVGKGLNTVSLTTIKPFDPMTVGIKIRDPQGEVRALRTVDVHQTSPQLLYYIDNHLYGVLYEQALKSTYTMTSNEEMLLAEPYFVSTDSRNNEILKYEWTVGEDEVPASGSIILAPEGNSMSTARVSARVIHGEYLFQSAQKQVDIRFNVRPSQSNNETTAL